MDLNVYTFLYLNKFVLGAKIGSKHVKIKRKGFRLYISSKLA